MKNFVLTGLLMLCLVLISNQAQGEKIIRFSGFDREDVPNLTLFVLSHPALDQLDHKPMPLDVMVGLKQMDSGFSFRAFAPNTEPVLYSLDKNYILKQDDRAGADKQPESRKNWKVVSTPEDEVTLLVGDAAYQNIPGLYPMSATVIDPATNYLYYSANVATRGINFTKIICYDLENSFIVNETVLNQDTSSFTPAERMMYQVHQLFLTADGKLLATAGSGVLFGDHVHVNE